MIQRLCFYISAVWSLIIRISEGIEYLISNVGSFRVLVQPCGYYFDLFLSMVMPVLFWEFSENALKM